ncbi:glycosyltransferase family 1 [Ophiocordyceps camponoti-floridani]|uniref:Glycosyltransferase family 1 n=1 Tax=Ophiocordyceps camponoti-floridani TaxID=2030778 RepID=A0A8H4Q9N4_9HYPO|nr:glycosyltransferase family 1 [Ophiocordyceps camponoti-floridani]
MESPLRILLLTNEQPGQSNVFIAACEALLRMEPGAELELASYGELAEPVAAMNRRLEAAVPEARPVGFRRLRGLSPKQGLQGVMAQAGTACEDVGASLPKSFFAPLSFSVTMRAIRDTMPIFMQYTAEHMVEAVASIEEVIVEVGADVVVVDSLLTPGLTACRHLGVGFVCLSPNSVKDFAAMDQPLRTRLKYPALFSGFRYPVPWYSSPLNTFYKIYTVVSYVADANRRAVAGQLQKRLGAKLVTAIEAYLGNDKPKTLVGSLPELDYPGLVPPHIITCGPIMRTAPSVGESDPELEAWLARGPTVYVNLGSLFFIDEEQALEMARALAVVLGEGGGRRVLWKLKRMDEYGVAEAGHPVFDALAGVIGSERVRIVIDWLEAEPLSILSSGHVVCAVHHGGANSFYEAVVTGVPQVVLPQWTDTYDYAERVELLGIGRLGNRSTMPRWTATELAEALTDVLTDGAVVRRAAGLAELCRERGSGADNAARGFWRRGGEERGLGRGERGGRG